MSLSDLGKNISTAETILDVYCDIVNRLSEIPKGTKEAGIIKELFDSMGGADKAVDAFRKLGVEGDALVTILKNSGVSAEGVEAVLAKTAKTGTGAIEKLKTGFDGFAKTLGMTSGALLGWIGGITAAVTIFTLVSRYIEKTKQHLLDCVNAADAAAESWNTQNAALESQIARIQELDAKKNIPGRSSSGAILNALPRCGYRSWYSRTGSEQYLRSQPHPPAAVRPQERKQPRRYPRWSYRLRSPDIPWR